MGTRSTIALEFADGTVEMVYCHWDGYLTGNGYTLFTHYSDPFKLQKLLDMGDISSLRNEIGEVHPFSPHGDGDKEAYDAAVLAQSTTFYGRDRGEINIDSRKFVDFQDYLAHHQYEEYEYILRPNSDKTTGTWYVKGYGTNGYVPLDKELDREFFTEFDSTERKLTVGA